MPVGPEVLLSLADHLPPGWRRRVNADSDERERRFGEDRVRDPERDRDDDWGERVREDVSQQEPAEPRPERTGALDELLLLDGEHLTARLPGDADPPGESDRDEDVRE